MANLKRVTSLVTEPITSDYHKVPTFANNTARDAAIPSPVVGMLIYNTDSGAVQQYNGTWSTIAPAPSIDNVSGLLNTDSDSTVTVFGANFTVSSIVKMFDVATGGSQVGSDATTTFVSATVLKGAFGAGSIPVAGTAVYIEVDNVGATSRFATSITVNADPTITHAGATGTGSNTTTHLGTYGGAGSGGAGDLATKLLLNFDRGGGRGNLSSDVEDSSNTGGTGHKVHNSGGGGETIRSSPFGDGKTAMYWAGANYITTNSTSEDFTFGTSGDFTVECWCNSLDGVYRGMISTMQSSPNSGWALAKVHANYSGGNDNIAVTFNNFTNAPLKSGNIAKADYEWMHVALERYGSRTSLYINGVERDFTTSALDFSSGSRLLTIGRTNTNSTADNFDGYIDEVRVVKGTAVYKTDFDVPTSRLTAITNTKLLVHSNLDTGGSGATTITDSNTAVTAKPLTNTGVIHSTLHCSHVEGTGASSLVTPAMPWPANGKKYGATGGFFDGAGDVWAVQPTTSPGQGHLNLDESETWTLDCWIYRVSTDANSHYLRVFATNVGGNPGWSLNLNAAPNCQLRFGADGGGNEVGGVTATRININTWYHVAVTATGGTLKMFINGTLAHIQASPAAWAAANIAFLVGARNNQAAGAYFWHGYIDGIRISNTVRWTGSTVGTNYFTPPTTMYGSVIAATLPTSPVITLTGLLASPGLAANEDIQFTSVVNETLPATTQHLTDTGIGLTLTNLAGGDKNKATLTGTVGLAAGTTRTGMAVKAQVRKTLSENTYNNSTTITFTGSTTTVGLSPGMPVTGTGISIAGPLTCGLTNADATVTCNPTTGLVVGMQVNAFTGVPAGATILSIITNTSFEISANATATDADAKLTFNTIIASVDSPTVITLSNITTGGSQSNNDLIFEDLNRVHHVNGAEVMNGSQAMLTIATGAGGDPVLFNARRFIGTSANREITGYGFQPDLIWMRGRDTTAGHYLFDCIRGAGAAMWPDQTGANYTYAGSHAQGSTRDGFWLEGSSAGSNQTTKKFIAWCFKAGGKPTATGKRKIDNNSSETNLVSSNTIASNNYHTNITNVKQSVNSVGDFSITQYTANSGGADAHICHGLSGAPDFIIIKNMAVNPWVVWHSSYAIPATQWLTLDSSSTISAHNEIWNQIAPSATSVTFGAHSYTNVHASQPYMMYAWKNVAGVSHFGGYNGTGSSGLTVSNVGFKPRFLMVKSRTGSGTWPIFDSFRSTPDVENTTYIDASTGDVEATTASYGVTLTSTGFTFDTGTITGNMNDGNSSYIYAAFA